MRPFILASALAAAGALSHEARAQTPYAGAANPAPANVSPAASAVTETAPPPPNAAPPPSTRHAADREGAWRLVAPEDLDVVDAAAKRPRGWFRLDTDARQTHFWVGGSFRLANGVALTPFAHVRGSIAEPNLAVSLQTGALWLMPAFGAGFDFATTNAVNIVPQLFLALDLKFVYLESWNQFFIGSAVHSGNPDTYYTRDMLLVVPTSLVAIGPQFEATWSLRGGPGDSLLSAPVGGRVNVRIGRNDTAGLFMGYETREKARGPTGNGDGIAGRFEYVHQW